MNAAIILCVFVTLSLGFKESSSSGSGVDDSRSFHDETILNKFADAGSGVGHRDLTGFVGIEPESLLSAFQDRGSNSLLDFQADHFFLFLFFPPIFLYFN